MDASGLEHSVGSNTLQQALVAIWDAAAPGPLCEVLPATSVG